MVYKWEYIFRYNTNMLLERRIVIKLYWTVMNKLKGTIIEQDLKKRESKWEYIFRYNTNI